MNKKEKRAELLNAAAQGVELRKKLCENLIDDIIDVATLLSKIVRKGGAVFIAGNGGSAADSQHFVTELVVRLTGKFERPSIPAVAFTADSSLLTAAGNDYGFDKIFARQAESLIGKKDALVLISTSGNSANLIEAAKVARKKNVAIVGLLGGRGGKLKKYATKSVIVPSNSVQRIQEEHIFIIHNIVHLMEQELFG
ncbi:MAG: SIS domain-containing protein [candidate division Zixibacteria bacterium]|nr:SIS domain-containing protein [candidate division Zixibacteria bacterium]